MWSIHFDSFNALPSRQNMFSLLWFTYCQYSVSTLNGFNSSSTTRDVTRGCSSPHRNENARMETDSTRLHLNASCYKPQKLDLSISHAAFRIKFPKLKKQTMGNQKHIWRFLLSLTGNLLIPLYFFCLKCSTLVPKNKYHNTLHHGAHVKVS